MSLVFDLHCDTPFNIARRKFHHIQPEKLLKQKYLGAVFAHFIKPRAKDPFMDAVNLLISTQTFLARKDNLTIMLNYRELDRKKVNILLGVEGGHAFDKSLKQVEILYGLGVRVLTITWNNSNRLAFSALDDDTKGLTSKGKEFIKELRNFDIIVDLSHASTRTVLDVCEFSRNPVIASHSCVRALNPTFLRNIDDRAIKAIAQRNGVVGINFSKYHLGKHTVCDHVDYLTSNFGLNVPAIGSDFDGINDPVYAGPQGLSDLEKELLQRKYKKTEIEKVFSKNFLRVCRKM